MSLLDASARLGLLSKPTLTLTGDRSTYRSVFVGYSVTVRDGHPDLQLGMEGAVPRLGLCLYPGYSAVLELFFALQMNLLLILDRHSQKEKGKGSRPDLKTEPASLGCSSLCICGLPIGDWSFVGTAAATTTMGSAMGGAGPDRR